MLSKTQKVFVYHHVFICLQHKVVCVIFTQVEQMMWCNALLKGKSIKKGMKGACENVMNWDEDLANNLFSISIVENILNKRIHAGSFFETILAR